MKPSICSRRKKDGLVFILFSFVDSLCLVFFSLMRLDGKLNNGIYLLYGKIHYLIIIVNYFLFIHFLD